MDNGLFLFGEVTLWVTLAAIFYRDREPMLLFSLFALGIEVLYYAALAFGFFGESNMDFLEAVYRPAHLLFDFSMVLYFVNGHTMRLVKALLTRGKELWRRLSGRLLHRRP